MSWVSRSLRCWIICVVCLAIVPACALAEEPVAGGPFSAAPVLGGVAEVLTPGSAQLAAEAERVSPGAVRMREESETRWSGLDAAASAKLAAEAFPGIVERADGGLPSLGGGERVSKYLSPYAARVSSEASSKGETRATSEAVIESLAPIAISEGGGLAPIELALTERDGSFMPKRSALPVSFPGDLSKGVTLPGAEVSLTPLGSSGSVVASASQGAVDGDAVFWGGASMGADVDVGAKPTTAGFDMLVDLRSQASPEMLRFEVGMPQGAKLVQQADGVVLVRDADQTLASVLPPSAVDAAGTPVSGLQMSIDGDVLAVTVPHPAGSYRYPIMVDPSVTDWQLTGQKGPYSGQDSPTNWRWAADGSKFMDSGWGTEALTISGSGAYALGEAGMFYYPIREGSEARIAEFSTEVSSTVEGHNAATVVQLENSSRQFEGNSEEFTTNISKSSIGVDGNCWPSGGSRWECPSNKYGSPGNLARLALRATGTGQGASLTALRSSVELEQEKGAELAYNKTSPTVDGGMSNVLYTGGWLGPHSNSAFEIQAKDPGLGISYVGIGGGGWGAKFPEYEDGECVGVQCDPDFSHAFTYSSSMTNGEDSLEAIACDEAEEPAECAFVWPQKIKVDATPPHSIVLTGLPESNEIGAGEYHLKAEATDGEGSTPSSGVKSIALYVDGRQVGSAGGSCPTGPCTAKGPEWTIDGRDYATGTHRLKVIATDNAGNVGVDEVLLKVHAVAPVSLGPGAVNPATGEYMLGASDVSLGGGLEVSRSYDSTQLTAGETGPLGPQWSLGMGGQESLEVEPDGSAVLTDSSGQRSIFTVKTGGEEGFMSPRGDANLTLTARKEGSTISGYVLADAASGTKTVFQQPSGGVGRWTPSIQEGPVATDTVSYSFQSVERHREYALPSGSDPYGIVKGPDGDLWVTDGGSAKVSRITPAGRITEYALPLGSRPCGITVGADGNIWVTEFYTNKVAKITMAGVITEYALPAESYPLDITSGPESDLWIADWKSGKVVKMSTAGTIIAEYPLPSKSEPTEIAAGPEGNIWIRILQKLVEMTPSGVVSKEYTLPSKEQPIDMVAGPGENLWFTAYGSAGASVGEINSTGAITEYAVPSLSQPQGLTVGPEGDLWFTMEGTNKIAKMTESGALTEYSLPSGSYPLQITTGAEGDLWFTNNVSNKVGVMSTSGTTITEPTEALAPVPAGVSCSPELKRGCRALTFNYAESTTATGEAPEDWGDYKGNLTRVYYHAWSNTAKAMQTVEVAHYLYDSGGRLREVWDPRIKPALKTTYGYDSEGHLTAVSPPGQQPWLISYGIPSGASTPGHVLKVMRPKASTSLSLTSAPEVLAAPQLSGAAVAGVALSASEGSWNHVALAYSFQWLRCNGAGGECKPIPGATNQSYTPGTSDVGDRLEAQVTATNAVGSQTTTSSQSAPVSAAGQITEYGLPTGSHPVGITAGPDGNVWFTDNGTGEVGKITTAGSVTEYASDENQPEGITTGPDGNIWFVEGAIRYVNHMTTSGELTSYLLTETNTDNFGIVTGPDNNLWFTESRAGRIGKINSKDEVLGEYELPLNTSEPYGITVGSDKNLWFVEHSSSKIGKITTGGAITEYSLPTGSKPYGIAAGPDANLWFTDEGTSKVGKITTTGAITEYSLPSGSKPRGITAGPEGNLWFAEYATNKIGEITPTGALSEYALPAGSEPVGIVTGPNGNDIWFTEYGSNKIGKIAAAPEGDATKPQPGTTIEYNVPVSGEGAPQNLGSEAAEKWGQKDDPVEATAIFPPAEPKGWPANSYKQATIYYRDAKGRAVNVATPTGAISTSEYNSANDVVRSLSAENRETALKEGVKSAEVAERLSTLSEYSSEGNELLSTLGPEHLVKLQNGKEVQARSHSVYSYDEGAPEEGGPYNLVTKTTQGVEVTGEGEQDVGTTLTGYSGQEGLGWKLRQPTSTTVDPTGLDLVSSTKYNPSTGSPEEARTPSANAEDVSPPEPSTRFGMLGSGSGELNEPEAVAVGPEGDAWVVDQNNNRIERFTGSGGFVASYGSGGTGHGQYNNAWGIAVNQKTGNVYIADTYNNRVEELNNEGVFVREWGSKGSGEGDFEGPVGIAIDGAGHVWVSDYGDDRVQEFSEAGGFMRQFGSEGSGEGQFKGAAQMVFSQGLLYVVDEGNKRVEEFSTSGSSVRYAGEFGRAGKGEGQLEKPWGITALPVTGTIFVSDEGGSKLLEYTAAGKYLHQVGWWGPGDNELEGPTGLGVSASGSVYVADQYNDRISVWKQPEAGGTHMTYSTQFGSQGSGEGQFEWAAAPAVDSHGDVWVSDYGDDHLQEFSPQGKFLASYGSEGEGDGQFGGMTGVAISQATDDAYVGDCDNHRIQQLGNKGEFIRAFTSEHLNCPAAVALDSSGDVWVADMGADEIEEFSPTGSFMHAYGSKGSGELQFNDPIGITVVGSTVYVADAKNNRIEEISTSGTYEGQISKEGPNGGELQSPEGISANSAGDLFVMDSANNRIEEFSPTGHYLQTIGSYGEGEGQLNAPQGITVTPAGDIYVTDAQNHRVQKWAPDTQAVHDTKTLYYSPGSEAGIEACENHPEWANLPCRTEPAAQPGDSKEGMPALPASNVIYNMYDQPTETIETAGTETRTSKVTYDEAGRPTTTEMTSSTGKPLPAVTNVYSEATGVVVEQKTSEGSETKAIKSAFNTLGQLTNYTDAGGASTSYEYEEEGDTRLKKRIETHGSQSYAYNETTGELTEVHDSAAGTFTAAYDPEGNMVSEIYPNGMIACPIYSHTGEETALTYYKSRTCGEGPEWFSDKAVPTAHGQWAAQQSSISAESYSYDAAGRLTEVLENIAGEGCTTRIYALDEEANRLSLTTRPPGSEGKCATEGGTVERHTYDEANRLTDEGVAYAPFGEITRLPSTDAGSDTLESSFYADGRLAEQHQGGQSIAYALDPERRVAEIIESGSTASTLINHYAGSGQTPSWTEEPMSGHWSRNIQVFGGVAALQEEDGEAVLQLEDLQGNIIATASTNESATKLLTTERQTEYGVSTTSKPKRYGWQGGNLLPRESTGAVAMGARNYIPQLGRFLQTDPQLGGSANQYTYTYGNPINETDPTGEWTFNTPGWVEEANAAWGGREAEAQIAREEAARREAERLAQEAAEAAAAQAAEAPTAGGAEEAGEVEEPLILRFTFSGRKRKGHGRNAHAADILGSIKAFVNAVKKDVSDVIKPVLQKVEHGAVWAWDTIHSETFKTAEGCLSGAAELSEEFETKIFDDDDLTAPFSLTVDLVGCRAGMSGIEFGQ